MQVLSQAMIKGAIKPYWDKFTEEDSEDKVFTLGYVLAHSSAHRCIDKDELDQLTDERCYELERAIAHCYNEIRKEWEAIPLPGKRTAENMLKLGNAYRNGVHYHTDKTITYDLKLGIKAKTLTTVDAFAENLHVDLDFFNKTKLTMDDIFVFHYEMGFDGDIIDNLFIDSLAHMMLKQLVHTKVKEEEDVSRPR